MPTLSFTVPHELDQGEVVGIVSFTDMILRGFFRIDEKK